jgi:hypothetical protein
LDIDKSIIIEELGEAAYANIIARVLEIATENPINKKISMSKEEIIDTIGTARYDEFVKKLINGFVQDERFVGVERLLTKLKLNFNIETDKDEILKKYVSPKDWFNLIKRSRGLSSNIGRY